MITISRQGTGYAVKVSEPGTGWRGYSLQAANLHESINVLRHYYEGGGEHTHDADPFCPLCRKLPRRSTWKESNRR